VLLFRLKPVERKIIRKAKAKLTLVGYTLAL